VNENLRYLKEIGSVQSSKRIAPILGMLGWLFEYEHLGLNKTTREL